jgi:predicted nuclease of predicted toxin-antitoxin system
MRILFDQGVPVPLRRTLAGHEVSTAFELGWANLDNGELLRVAEEQFDLLVTTDRNLRYQQNLAGRRLGILVLPTTNWLELRKHQLEVTVAVNAMQPGEYRELRWPG